MEHKRSVRKSKKGGPTIADNQSGIPRYMNAVRLHTASGPDGLVYEQIETPKPKAGEVLVHVHAAAITRDELSWPTDRLPAIPCYEFSGVVAALGDEVENVNVGEAVFALSAFNRDGAAADYVVVSKECLAPKPKLTTHPQSASIPLAALTAWQGLFEHGHLTRGQRVLIHGATGGVGSFAAQLARQSGAHVLGTVSAMNIAAAQKLGVDEIIDQTKAHFEEVTGQVDLVFDTVGGSRLEHSPSVVRPDGWLVSVASEPPQELAKAHHVHALYFVVKPNGEQLAELASLVDRGQLKPVIDRVFPLANAREAFERSLVPHPAGKIVLRMAGLLDNATHAEKAKSKK